MDEGFENATIAESANVTFGQFGPMMQSYNDDEDAALKGLIKFVFIFIRLVIQVSSTCFYLSIWFVVTDILIEELN